MAEKKNWGYEGQGKSFDSELSRKALFGFLGALVLLMVLVVLAMRGLFGFLEADLQKEDPAPSPIAEADLPRLPPEPRLQTHPTLDLDQLRAREDSLLMSYGWEDEAEGIARIPVERAMEIIASEGVPSWPAVDPAAEGAQMNPGELGSSQ